MTRSTVPLHTDDISSFAKALGGQLAAAHAETARTPGHVELLNMLARAVGHRNYQSLKAAPPPAARPVAPPAAADAVLGADATRALRLFDAAGRVQRWPVRRSVQVLMLWGLWMRFDASRRYTEREVNELLNAWHLFGDHCTLRRELVELKLLGRKDGGAEYRTLLSA